MPSIKPQSDYFSQTPTNSKHSVHLFHLFYSYFYQAHPFILPREYLSEKLSKADLQPLRYAIDYIGSCYDPTMHRQHFQRTAECELLKQDISRDVYSVQALLIFSIGLISSDERAKAELSLKLAINLALELGMNRREFAWPDGQGCPVNEESWRRTWWELYIIDGHFAAAHPSKTFRLLTVPADTLLPCEDGEYFSGQIPSSHSIDEFTERCFSSASTDFSSYAYRIEAIRIYAKALCLESNSFIESQLVDDADASLMSFWLYLPDTKKRLVGLDGRFDEVLFQAHMLVYSATMLLHRSRSSLAYTQGTHDNGNTAGQNAFQPGNLDFHTGKTLYAADMIAKLVTVPRPMVTHSPLFACGLALSCIVHLTAWPLFVNDGTANGVHIADVTEKASLSYYESPEQFYSATDPNSGNMNPYADQGRYASPMSSQSSYSTGYRSDGQQKIKDKIQLQVGALLNLGKVWPSASKQMESVKLISRQVFAWSKTKQMEVSLASQSGLAASGVAPDLMFNSGLIDFLWNRVDDWTTNASYDFSQINDLDASLLHGFHMEG
ncbi:hypothetical protein FQN54_008084 [Arachnomyces sp. PD_36]|nr:hypothetical protein FQN54_008084 [Arachnomyces sp. PD_36]